MCINLHMYIILEKNLYVKNHVCSLQYTVNSKKVEIAVKRIISGEDVKQRGALANPQSLDLFYNIPELNISST